MSFKALVVEQDADAKTSASVQSVEESQLPDGEVIVAIEYSTLNFKDGLCMGPSRGLVRSYPHIPGVDCAGTVEASTDGRYKAGDKVIMTGWRVGEVWWGGYAQKGKFKADWLVPLPEGLSTYDAMCIGTAGYTAMQSLIALEDHGLSTDNGPVLVTGAAGGVGSIATSLLSSLGYEVAAVSGRPEASPYLTSLGATTIVARDEINIVSKKPMESEQWAGCIDSVGGEMLARIIGQMKYGSSIAAVGLVGGTDVPMSVIPLLLRSLNILGIDSVTASFSDRVRTWQRIVEDLPLERLRSVAQEATLYDMPQLGDDILNGKIKGRVVVDVNAGH